VLRRIFEPERDEIIGDWRKLHSDQSYNSYPALNITGIINQGG
jgi:hypothetical protein